MKTKEKPHHRLAGTFVKSCITNWFSRRGYNIDSLTVGVTADPRYSCNSEA